MLQLRKDHLDAFARAGEPGFEKSVMRHLREHHQAAVAGLTDDRLRMRVRFGLARARRYGFEFQNNLTAFVAHMFEVAPNFDEHPAIEAVLRDSTVEPEQRMDLLFARTRGQDWVEARQNGDPKLWEQAHG